MRGKLDRTAKKGYNLGITPADAGKTRGAFRLPLLSQDHPRGCGENGDFNPRHAHFWGSPPRMRGKQLSQRGPGELTRITPADAGKTLFMSVHTPMPQDHPRGCGENAITILTGWGWIGSPPRMRGKPAGHKSPPEHCRITPADAGKTLKRSFRNQPFCS